MKTVTDLLIALGIIALLGGCLSGTARASDYSKIGKAAAYKYTVCVMAFEATTFYAHMKDKTLGQMICADIVARDLALKAGGSTAALRRDGEIK